MEGGWKWSGVTGGRSRVTAAGNQLQQEWGNAAGPGLGGGVVPVVQSEGGRSRVPMWHTIVLGSTGTLGEESLWCPYMPPSHDWCVPININIGKFHCRVTCQCGPAAVAKLQLPSCLDRLG